MFCNDLNPCTSDSCNASTGSCVSTAIQNCTCTGCDTSDPCNIPTCINGTCVYIRFTCPSTKCMTLTPISQGSQCVCSPSHIVTCPPLPPGYCGENVCDAATGTCKATGGRICNDNDPCTEDTCQIVNGNRTCLFKAITCQGDSPCSRKKCVNNNGLPVCVDDPLDSILCDTDSQCVQGSCNTTIGKCVYKNVECVNANSSSCSRNVCDAASRKCVPFKGIQCLPSDPMGCGTNGTCAWMNNEPTCVYEPKCAPVADSCTVVSCLPSLSKLNQSECITSKVNCDDGNPCTLNDRCISHGFDTNGNPITNCTFDAFICNNSTDPCHYSTCVNNNGVPTCVPKPIVCPTLDKVSKKNNFTFNKL